MKSPTGGEIMEQPLIENSSGKSPSQKKSKATKAMSENGSSHQKLVVKNPSQRSTDVNQMRHQVLLQNHNNGVYEDKQAPNDQDNETGEDTTNIFLQFWIVCKLSSGPIVSMVFYMLVQLINTYFIGHTNEPALIAGVGMGNMLINVLAFAIIQGLNGALETYVSQSFGSGLRRECGMYLNRGRVVVCMIMIPIIIIFAVSDKILVAIHQDPGVSKTAQVYVTVMIPGVWAMGLFDALKKFLSAQYKNGIPVYTQLITTILHFGWCYLFISKLGMREYGAATATNLTYILNCVISETWVYALRNSDFKDMIFFFDRSSFTGLGKYLKIGVPGMLMLCFEWWAFELLAIFSGLLGVNELAAEVVIINIVAFIFMLPLGISYSASALTGNYLGAGKIDMAKRYAFLTIALNVILTSIIVLLFGIYTQGIAELFTQDKAVIKILKDTLWVLLIYIWFDTIHGVQSGIIRGLGRQVYGSVYTLICYYIIGMPLALVLTFNYGMGIAGLWLGFSIACIILDVGFAMIISCKEWQKVTQDKNADYKSDLDCSRVMKTPTQIKKMLTPVQNKKQITQKKNTQIEENQEVPRFNLNE